MLSFPRRHFSGTSPRYNVIKTKKLITTLLCLYLFSYILPSATSAQVIHQSFEIGERKAINLSLDIPYEVEVWAGNTILTETKVEIENVAPNILKHFINLGRYKIIENLSDSAIELKLKEINRRPIQTSNGEATEIVNIKIFVPESCKITHLGKGNLIAAEQTGEK
jgi:hypothetical protein